MKNIQKRRRRAILRLTKELPDFFAKGCADILTGQCISDVCREEADLGAAIESPAFEFQSVEWHVLGQADHGVGQLNFSTGPAFLSGEDIENFRLQNIAPGN